MSNVKTAASVWTGPTTFSTGKCQFLSHKTVIAGTRLSEQTQIQQVGKCRGLQPAGPAGGGVALVVFGEMLDELQWPKNSM